MKRLKEERKRKDEEGAKKTREAVQKRKEEQAKFRDKMMKQAMKVRFTSDTPTEGSGVSGNQKRPSGKKTVSDRIFEKMHIKKIKPITNTSKVNRDSIRRGRDILKR